MCRNNNTGRVQYLSERMIEDGPTLLAETSAIWEAVMAIVQKRLCNEIIESDWQIAI